MARSRAQNEALAAHVAELFRGLLRPVTSGRVPEPEIALLDFSLQAPQLDRKRLWERYLGYRLRRDNAKHECWKALPWDMPAEEKVRRINTRDGALDPLLDTVNLYAFLARACLAPASALKGRALFFIEQYVKEGFEHAAWLLAPTDEPRRKELLELWTAAIPNLSNLDRRQEALYVPSNARYVPSNAK